MSTTQHATKIAQRQMKKQVICCYKLDSGLFQYLLNIFDVSHEILKQVQDDVALQSAFCSVEFTSGEECDPTTA